jgi:twitching motility protein PilT
MPENKDTKIDHLIEKYTKDYNLSDLHIRSNQPLAIREHGEIATFPDDVVSE